MRTNNSPAARIEQALNPNRVEGVAMDEPHARFHEVGLAVLQLKEAERRMDPNNPYLAATATSAHTDFDAIMQREMSPEYIAATSAPTTPASPEVQQHAAAQAFQNTVQQIDSNYIARDVAPQTPQIEQFEQPRA